MHPQLRLASVALALAISAFAAAKDSGGGEDLNAAKAIAKRKVAEEVESTPDKRGARKGDAPAKSPKQKRSNHRHA